LIVRLTDQARICKSVIVTQCLRVILTLHIE